jgi:3-oxoacyl-[acyl-carrier-protein] synthase III
MTADPHPAILGLGQALPTLLRGNDDPVFDWIRANDPTGGKLFTGYVERHVLAGSEAIEDFMAAAARAALADAQLQAKDIDLMLGYSSVSEYASPNGLARVHALLGLDARCWPLPVAADFSNFSAGLLLADALVAAGRARNVLVVCGADWTRFVNYHTPECVSAGDGAGAAVLGLAREAARWRVADFESCHRTSGYGGMFMRADLLGTPPQPLAPPGGTSWSQPYFHITPEGLEEYKVFGTQEPPRVVGTLLDRNALAAADVTLVPYQASLLLIDAWTKALQPAATLHTLPANGNMVIANLAVNLAAMATRIVTDRVVLVGLGPEPHASALLLERG